MYNNYMNEYYKTLNLEGHGPINKNEFIDLNKIVASLKNVVQSQTKQRDVQYVKEQG